MRVLVSGASRGLGAALALYLAERDYDVVAFARSKMEPSHERITYVSMDVHELEPIFSYLADCDGIVNNVGIVQEGLLATQSVEHIRQMIDVNLTSVICLTKFWVRERLRVRKTGSCVTISSIVSNTGFSGLSVYSATKGATNSLTKTLAREMGSLKFRFNSVLPGYFESTLSSGLSEEHKKKIIRKTPLGRLATVDDICPMVEFLLSDKSSFVTGQLIKIDGGLTV